jgi:hypothetical protein
MSRLAPIALTLLLLAGCSRFERDWKAAIARPAPATNPASIDGPWQGRWQSDAGHGGGDLGPVHGGGDLRCILRAGEDGRYQARFRATFAGFLKAGYIVRLTATPQAGGLRVEGSEDLGFLAGGQYRYEGTITAEQFLCTYRSKHDHGTFRLARP